MRQGWKNLSFVITGSLTHVFTILCVQYLLFPPCSDKLHTPGDHGQLAALPSFDCSIGFDAGSSDARLVARLPGNRQFLGKATRMSNTGP
jgi:hypothetical protein